MGWTARRVPTGAEVHALVKIVVLLPVFAVLFIGTFFVTALLVGIVLNLLAIILLVELQPAPIATVLAIAALVIGFGLPLTCAIVVTGALYRWRHAILARLSAWVGRDVANGRSQ